MIVDAHAHIWERNWLPKWFWDGLLRGRTAQGVWDGSGDTMVKSMDVAGIDKTMICCLDWELVAPLSEAIISIEDQNRLHAMAVERHPDRLLWAVGVDPRRRNAVKILERGVKDLGAKALKLYPPAGFYPNDKMVYPLYERCVELEVPVDLHTGPIGVRPLRSKFSQPIFLDDVAKDFPELTIIATHTGHGSWQEMVSIARANQNILCDLAGWQVWMGSPISFYRTLRFIIDMIGAHRLLFATDSHGSNQVITKRWVNMFTNIPEWMKAERIVLTKEEISKILSENAVRIYKI